MPNDQPDRPESARQRIRLMLANCRLCLRVGLVVMISIVVVEAIILIPSYRNYERDLLRRLEREGLASVSSLFLMGHHMRGGELGMMAKRMMSGSVVRGLVVREANGRLVARVGHAPAPMAGVGPDSPIAYRRSGDGNSYDVRWGESALDAPFVATARLDSSWVAGELRAFVWRIIGLVLLLSAVVTAATMVILGRSVLIPVLRLRRNLVAAADDPEHPDRYTIEVDRRDELGDVMVAFNQMIHDVASTHRREMQRVVAMSENSIAAVMAFDAEGSLVYCNRAALALCGAGNAPALNRSGYPRVPDGDASPMPLSRYLSRAATTQEITLEVAPGRSVPCVVGGNRLHGEDGAVELSYASILEISEMQAYRERLELKNLELAAANRAKSEFLAHMSHELRTPLNAILGFSEMMSDETLGPLGSPRYREYATDINESGTHLLNIISDILDLSKIEAGKTELSEQVVEVPEMLTACRRLVAERAVSSGIELVMEWRDPLPALRADPRLLKQIVLNLLSNAIKFTPSGGTVTVRAEYAAGGALAISVSDSGCGMAPEDIPTALAPFGQVGASLMSKQAGTGLGLPLVKAFVELHQGWLHIDSELGSGTIVTVSLPKERVIAAGSTTASRSSAA